MSTLSATKVRAIVATAAVGAAIAVPVTGAQAAAGSYFQRNLVSDIPGRAQLTDPHVVNPWGIALGTGATATPLWVANNGTSTATIYTGATGHDVPVTAVPLVVKTSPGVTGQVFNDTTGFSFRVGGSRQPSRFLFDGFAGNVSAWSNLPAPAAKVSDVAVVRNHVYVGLAISDTPDGPRLYAADATGGIDVFGSGFRLVTRPGAFRSPPLPNGLTPYNVAVLGSKVYVAYASQADVAIKGAINVFDLRGHFERRLVTGNHLDGPWGMVMAPAGWGRFGGALLVGNEDDGRINAYNAHSGAWLGTLRNSHGMPLVNHGLWGLAFGNGVFGRPDDLIFAAGIGEYRHGLIGVIRPS